MKKWDDISSRLEIETPYSVEMEWRDKPRNTANLDVEEFVHFLEFRREDWASVKDWKKVKSVEIPSVCVFDVAAYILEKKGSMSTMKLQKLVYYSQAWSLVWDEKPLFKEPIEAWANGPVVRTLFDFHRGMFDISSMPLGNSRLLNQEQCETVDAVLDYYGDKSAQWLIELTHLEDPWLEARKGLLGLERGNRVISWDSIAEYYSSIPEEDSEDGG